MRDDPAFRLGRAIDQRRVILRQTVGVAGVVAGFVVWRVVPLNQPEPFTSAIFIVGGVALTVLVVLLVLREEEERWCADRLIVSTRGQLAGKTPISTAVARRVQRLESARFRHRLAEALVWRLRLAEGEARPSVGYMRASVLPPLSRQERCTLVADRRLALRIAERIAGNPADPVALVLLVEWMTMPPPINDEQAAEAARELHLRLVRVARLLDVEPSGRDASTAIRPAI